MWTTVTLDDDLAAALQRLAHERGTGFEQVLNEALRQGLSARAEPYRVPARPLGLRDGVDLTKALRLAADEEDDQTLREPALRE